MLHPVKNEPIKSYGIVKTTKVICADWQKIISTQCTNMLRGLKLQRERMGEQCGTVC